MIELFCDIETCTFHCCPFFFLKKKIESRINTHFVFLWLLNLEKMLRSFKAGHE